jgi:putative transposase
VFPCKELHKIWKQWLAAYRWVYNKCVELLVGGFKSSKECSLDQKIQELQPEWTKCLGKTRQEAVCEAESAYRQARKAWFAKPEAERGKFNMRFRSCRDKSQVIQFKNDAYNNGTWFPTKVKDLLYCTAWGYQVPQNCVYGTELVYQRGQWFACFPQYIPLTTTGSDKVIALDPGNRTFLTGFDGDNILEIGKGDIGRLTRLCLHLDKLISRKTKAKGKANKKLRYKLNKAISRLRSRIRCLVDDLHHKATSLLINSYKLIFLPTYETSQMVVKATRKINHKSVRNMLTWAMGRFASHLEQAAKRKGVLVVRTNESYTSKTCPHCGKIHSKLGGNKIFKCPSCGYTSQRDWVGALNNMLRALSAIAFSVVDGVITISDGDVRVAQGS